MCSLRWWGPTRPQPTCHGPLWTGHLPPRQLLTDLRGDKRTATDQTVGGSTAADRTLINHTVTGRIVASGTFVIWRGANRKSTKLPVTLTAANQKLIDWTVPDRTIASRIFSSQCCSRLDHC